MDIDRQNLIVPAAATRRLQLAGGQSMEQAVPDEYVLAAMVFRAMEKREARSLEFVLKSYLPVAIINSHEPSRFFLMELLGLTSESITTIHRPDLKKIQEKVEKADNPDELSKLIRIAIDEIGKTLESVPSTILGLLPGLITRGVSKILDRPSGQSIEDYSVSLTGLINSSEFDKSILILRENSESLALLNDMLTEFLQLAITRIDAFVGTHKAETTPILSRLALRVESLEQQIESLESQRKKTSASASPNKHTKLSDIDALLKVRKVALERDRKRQLDVVTNLESASHDLATMRNELTAESNRVMDLARGQLEYLHDMIVPARFDDCGGKKKSIIMIPFFIAGFSKRDKLNIEVYPLSYFQGNSTKVSRRRNFVDVFLSPSRAIDALTALLEDRANNDVAFRKFIRDSSKDYNLLADARARESIKMGTESLLGDALVKRPLVDELNVMISGIPVTKVHKKKKRILTPTISDGSLCAVKFHVQNESGKPVEAAEIEFGALLITSDSNGIATTLLPRSHYEGQVRASGYLEKTIEFSITTTDDVVIPIVIVPLAHEEQLALKLDELAERARRLDNIRERLLDAFEKQGPTLLGIPAYRTALVELLSELGYEPESWIAEARQKTGMVKRLLKRDNRIDGIRRDVLRMAEASKAFGGIMLFSELLVRLDDLGWSTNPDEIESIINEMAKEGLIRGLSHLESGALLVEFVPVALTNDPQMILDLAAQNEGRLTIEDAVVNLSWTEARVKKALDLLISNGVAKEQRSYSKSTQYFFPGLRGERNKLES